MIIKEKKMGWSRDWWCPTDRRFVLCDGACPDGTPHVLRARWKEITYIRSSSDDAQEVRDYIKNRGRTDA